MARPKKLEPDYCRDKTTDLWIAARRQSIPDKSADAEGITVSTIIASA